MALTLKVQLVGITKPPVWRRIVIPNDSTFQMLHEAIQAAFGWWNYHLWCFHGSRWMGDGWVVERLLEDELWDAREPDADPDVRIQDFGVCNPFYYTYDYGDSWLHSIKIEKVDGEPCPCPKCIAGKGEDPQEDMGGVYGFLRRREHPEEFEDE